MYNVQYVCTRGALIYVCMYTTDTSGVHLPSVCTDCLRCELSEKQRLLEAKEREVEVERANNQRRLLQLERAVDEKCKEAQSLKVRMYTTLHACIVTGNGVYIYIYV